MPILPTRKENTNDNDNPDVLARVAFALVAAFVPTTRQMAAIVMVPKIANNEKVQAAGNKLYDLAVEWMDELRPRKKAGDEEK